MMELFQVTVGGLVGLLATFMIVEVSLSFLKKGARAGAGESVE